VRLSSLSPGSAAALLAAAAAAALLAESVWSVAAIAAVLLLVCLRAPTQRRGPYLFGALTMGLGVLVVSPWVWSSPTGTILWEGPILPVLGPLDLTTTELVEAAMNGLALTAVALAFSAYALLLDHDRLVAAAGFARRSALAVALATRLVPSLERDAVGFAEAIRGRGVVLEGVRGYASLLSPLVAGSLERASNLAEAMESRGFGRPGATRAPRPPWRRADRLVLVAALALVVVGALWL
jgi:energy-coupling factor transport system permease protein